MAIQEGIDGVDLVELKLISQSRLPPVVADFDSARRTADAFKGEAFARTGPIGKDPSASFQHLCELLVSALQQSQTNLTDTATAIQHFLNEILAADDGARERMNKAEAELNGVPTP